MSRFKNSSGPCVCGSSPVLMAGGGERRADAVEAGDRVAVGDGTDATVRCVVRTPCTGGAAELVKVGRLTITPWHPVRRGEGAYQYPCRLATASEPRRLPCDAVYSFLLQDGRKELCIGGQRVVAWGHGLQDRVARHDFFGTERVVAALRKLPGWSAGRVVLRPEWLRRDSAGLVCDIASPPRQQPAA